MWFVRMGDLRTHRQECLDIPMAINKRRARYYKNIQLANVMRIHQLDRVRQTCVYHCSVCLERQIAALSGTDLSFGEIRSRGIDSGTTSIGSRRLGLLRGGTRTNIAQGTSYSNKGS